MPRPVKVVVVCVSVPGPVSPVSFTFIVSAPCPLTISLPAMPVSTPPEVAGALLVTFTVLVLAPVFTVVVVAEKVLNTLNTLPPLPSEMTSVCKPL